MVPSYSDLPSELTTERLRLRVWRPSDAERPRPRVRHRGGPRSRRRDWNAPSFRVLEKLDFHRTDRVTEDPNRGNLIWMTRVLNQPTT